MTQTITINPGPVTCVCGLSVRMPEFVCAGCSRDAGRCICSTYRTDPDRWLAKYARRTRGAI